MEEQNLHRRRVNGSYFTAIVSTSLVLFSLGLFGLVFLHAHKLSNYIRENIGVEIVMKDGIRESAILALQKTLDASPYVKSTQYITQEEATEYLKEQLGTDLLVFEDESDQPYLPSLDVRFNAAWANNDSLQKIEQELLMHPDVKDVYYQKSLVHLINHNIQRIGIVILIFTGLMLTIAVALINNTIRLSVYSKRFTIRSMQLVGATESFIQQPFVWRSIWQGIFAALIADLFLLGIVYVWRTNMPEIKLIQDLQMLGVLFIGIILAGIVFSWLSTLFAVRKYLRIPYDKMFA